MTHLSPAHSQIIDLNDVSQKELTDCRILFAQGSVVYVSIIILFVHFAIEFEMSTSLIWYTLLLACALLLKIQQEYRLCISSKRRALQRQRVFQGRRTMRNLYGAAIPAERKGYSSRPKEIPLHESHNDFTLSSTDDQLDPRVYSDVVRAKCLLNRILKNGVSEKLTSEVRSIVDSLSPESNE